MKDAAIQFLIYKPEDPPVPEAQRGVVVNPRHRQRFKQFVPIGVFREGPNLKYYFFDQCDKNPRIYNSLDELKSDLPEGLENIFENKPKFFIMGHGSGGHYGLSNFHGPSEQIYGTDDPKNPDNGKYFDTLIDGVKQTLTTDHGEIFVTLEGCNTDSKLDAAAAGQTKTFLERVSEHHKEITFGGTGPWDPQDYQTGFRSLSPTSPITSMAGNVWKAGNSVIFYHGDLQIAVRKSLFATTKTAKELKINTIEYARSLLGPDASNELISSIALRRDILTIQDLQKIDGFPELQLEGESVSKFIEQENQIIGKEQERYLTRVRDILDRSNPIDQLTDRDIIQLLLGLKDQSVFKGHEDLLTSILANKPLLHQMMVGCGKVLVGGPSNDRIIDLLIEHGADINSTDDKGMTALHYAAQNFYNYRKEPLNLIKKLLDSGARLDLQNNGGQTPLETAQEHSKDSRVTDSDKLLTSLAKRHSVLTPIEEMKQSVKQSFQMSQHRAHELRSLRPENGGYLECDKGTLYFPSDAVKKLNDILQSAKGNQELWLAFEAELIGVISALEQGIGTGKVNNGPKRFEDATLKLQLKPILDALVAMKREVANSKDPGVEGTFSESKPQSQLQAKTQVHYRETMRQVRESQPDYMKSTESSRSKEREKHIDTTPKPPWRP